MKEFNVFRYLKQFSLLIVLWTAFGVLLVHGYVQQRQQYTASAVLVYANPAEGKANLDEITASAVTAKAMDLLGDCAAGLNLHAICTVTLLSAEEEKADSSASERVRVELTVPGSYGEETARRALDALLQSYSAFYTAQYVAESLPLPSSKGLTLADEPYLSIQRLEADGTDMLQYLQEKQRQYPQFRSARTGFSFADLEAFYQTVLQTEIPVLYGQAMTAMNAQQRTLMQASWQSEIQASFRREESRNAQKEKLLLLLQTCAEENGTQTMLNGAVPVEQAKAVQTTADRLILELVALDVEMASDAQNRALMQQRLELLSSETQETANPETLAAELQQLQQSLDDGDELVTAMVQELNQVLGAKALKTASSIQVTATLNETLYPLLALVLFLLLGCGGAVVLGRLIEVRTELRAAMKEALAPAEDPQKRHEAHA